MPKHKFPIPSKSASKQNQVKSLMQQGFALHQQGNLKEAKALYERTLALDANHFDALQLLGALMVQIEQYSQAVEFLAKALQLKPQHVGCCINHGLALRSLGRLDEALISYNQVLCIEPNFAESYSTRGLILQELKCLDEALIDQDKAISIKPDYAEAHSNRGLVLHDLKRLDEALASYDHAISIKPDYAQAHYNRGLVLHDLKRFDEALASYDRAISLKPDYPVAHLNRGNALKELMRFDGALASYDRAISIKPDFADAHSNRGNVLQVLKRFDEALISHNQAIRIQPDYAETHLNLGNALQGLLLRDQALASYDRAISIKPDFAEAHWNLSLCKLLTGNFTDGWQEYEWRWKAEGISKNWGFRAFPQPLWLGSQSLQDKTILLHAEQGYGDTMQFCRYASLVAKLGAKVILEVQRPLLGLLKNLDGVSQVIARGDALPEFDYQCPLLSLPLAFKTQLHNIPSSLRYLASDSEKMSAWQAKLSEKTKPRIGLVWSGNLEHKNDRNRSLTLSQILPYLPSGYQYICLQKELRSADRAILAQHPQIQFFGDALEDFTDTAALCDLRDLVISVDTSVAHLSASLGKPTWVLLPFCPDWRWLLDREDSPWYPSAKLYRQENIGDWSGVLSRVREGLEGGNTLFDNDQAVKRV
jgi:tetratricopeptide (TPR) repeat protein